MSKKVIITEDGKKQCSKCGEWKSLDRFSKSSHTKCGYRSHCKDCVKADYEAKRDAISARSKRYYQENKDIIKENVRKYCLENAEKVKHRKHEYTMAHREEKRAYDKVYNEKNRDRRNQRERERIATDPVYAMKHQVCNLIRFSFYRAGLKKDRSSKVILGADSLTVREHLLRTFYENYGYEWDGVEKIHIDHIIPLATATTIEDVVELCHYTNLQLLKAKDNLAKSDKLDWKLNESEGIKDGDNQMLADAE